MSNVKEKINIFCMVVIIFFQFLIVLKDGFHYYFALVFCLCLLVIVLDLEIIDKEKKTDELNKLVKRKNVN
jgi:hypothetical protein